MTDNQGFARAFGWNVFYQKILGIPTTTGTEMRIWFWVVLMIVCSFLPQTASLPILWGDLNSIIDCLSTNASMIVSILKILFLQFKRKAIASILVKIARDWLTVRTKTELEIMSETADISRFVSIISVSLCNIVFVQYVIFQISISGADHVKDPRLASGFLCDAYFPFDTSDRLIFVPIWLGQFFALLLAVVAYSGPDCFVSMAALHLCGQLKIIRHSLRNLIDEKTAGDPSRYWERLGAIVRKHENLNELATILKETFSSILLVQMLACTVIFCFQGYAMFTTVMDRNGSSLSILDVTFRVLYGIFSVTHLFVYCYVGDRLLNESAAIADDFYDSAWYTVAPKESRAFLFVCHRSTIPLELKAGKFCTFNLALFNNILKSSMGYLSMLMAMKERLID